MQVELMQKAAYRILPPGIREAVSAFYGFSYDNYVLDKYLPAIEQVLNMPNAPEVKAFPKHRMALESVMVDRFEPSDEIEAVTVGVT